MKGVDGMGGGRERGKGLCFCRVGEGRSGPQREKRCRMSKNQKMKGIWD